SGSRANPCGDGATGARGRNRAPPGSRTGRAAAGRRRVPAPRPRVGPRAHRATVGPIDLTPTEPETLPAIPSRVAALFLTVASGVLYGCAFPTTAWRPLAWVALVPWLWALRGASFRRALALGWVWSVVAAYTVGDWFAPSFAQYYQQPVALGVLFFVA